jgi:two-component system, OmpR family, KDP operon response regulator KdpE
MSKIVVVDDELPFARALAITLRGHGYTVETAATGEEGITLIGRSHPDLVVLDLGLPGIDGMDVLRAVRGWTTVPIVVLSARDAEAGKVEALDNGADDYITKPFGVNELLARIRVALRRRTEPLGEPLVATESFTLDLAAKVATRADGTIVRLTPTEWAIVEMLVRSPGKLVPQRQLLREVWGPQYETETPYLRVYLAAIRRKLELNPPQPRHFITEPGMGYRFER